MEVGTLLQNAQCTLCSQHITTRFFGGSMFTEDGARHWIRDSNNC